MNIHELQPCPGSRGVAGSGLLGLGLGAMRRYLQTRLCQQGAELHFRALLSWQLWASLIEDGGAGARVCETSGIGSP